MTTDRRRHPAVTRQQNVPANPDANADQPIIVAVPQAPHDPTHDVVDFPPTYPRGVIVGDLSVLGLTEDGAEESNAVSWAMASPNFSQTEGAEAGWRIQDNGDAEFNNVTVRGTVEASKVIGSTGVNLIPNGEFETDISGWTAGSNCSIAWSNSPIVGIDGDPDGFLKITPTAPGDCSVHSPTGTNGISVEGSTVYQLQRYILGEDVRRGTYCYPTFYDVDGNLLGSTEANVHGYWQEYGLELWNQSNPFSFLSPPTAAFMTINIEVLSASADYHGVDHVTAYKSSYMEGGLIIVPRILTNLDDLAVAGAELESSGTLFLRAGSDNATEPASVYSNSTGASVGDLSEQLTLVLAAPGINDLTQPYLEVRSPQGDGSTDFLEGLYLQGCELTTSDGTDYATSPTDYGDTGSFTSSGTAPTGKVWQGFYRRLGKLVEVWINSGFGGSMTAGTGTYRFDVPFTVDTALHPANAAIGEAVCIISGTNFGGTVQVQAASRVRIVNDVASNLVAAGVPFAFNANSTIYLHFSYFTDQ